MFPSKVLKKSFILCTDAGINYTSDVTILWMRQQQSCLWEYLFTPGRWCVCVWWTETNRRISCFILWLTNTKHEHVRLATFFFSLFSPTFPRVSHLPSCVTPSCGSVHLTFSSVSVYLRLSAWLTQGITPTPNIAELKQTHFATVKINHFLFFSLALFLFLSLAQSPLFSHNENKLLGLYLFYVGRPDHRRVSFGPFQP